jgi:ribosomal protein S18 acetylase RimI-like enzyme
VTAPDLGSRVNTLEIREATVGDAPQMAILHIRSWQQAYRGVLPDELLDGLSVGERESSWRTLIEDDQERWLTLVSEDTGSDLIGLCSMSLPSHDSDAAAKTAEIGALYVDPDHWRRGVGTALLNAALKHLGAHDWREVVLWVLPENRPALSFYESFGFAVDPGIEKLEERSGRPVIRLRKRSSRR